MSSSKLAWLPVSKWTHPPDLLALVCSPSFDCTWLLVIVLCRCFMICIGLSFHSPNHPPRPCHPLWPFDRLIWFFTLNFVSLLLPFDIFSSLWYLLINILFTLTLNEEIAWRETISWADISWLFEQAYVPFGQHSLRLLAPLNNFTVLLKSLPVIKEPFPGVREPKMSLPDLSISPGFWEIGNYKTNVRRIKEGIEQIDELSKMAKERAEIECKYSKMLQVGCASETSFFYCLPRGLV